MTQDKLQDELSRLRAEIAKINTTDSQSKAKLERLLEDIERGLTNPENNSAADDQGIMDDLKDAINRFETEHPRTTAILNDIMVTLSNMGI